MKLLREPLKHRGLLICVKLPLPCRLLHFHRRFALSNPPQQRTTGIEGFTDNKRSTLKMELNRYKHRLCNLSPPTVQRVRKGKTQIYPAACTAVTTLEVPDSEDYTTNHQVFSILTVPFTAVTLQFCFALLKRMERVMANCCVWNQTAAHGIKLLLMESNCCSWNQFDAYGIKLLLTESACCLWNQLAAYGIITWCLYQPLTSEVGSMVERVLLKVPV